MSAPDLSQAKTVWSSTQVWHWPGSDSSRQSDAALIVRLAESDTALGSSCARLTPATTGRLVRLSSEHTHASGPHAPWQRTMRGGPFAVCPFVSAALNTRRSRTSPRGSTACSWLAAAAVRHDSKSGSSPRRNARQSSILAQRAIATNPQGYLRLWSNKLPRAPFNDTSSAL
jgi:hypothetical protein